MRIHEQDASVAFDVIDDGHMSVRIIENRARLDGLAVDARRIEIGRFHIRMQPVHRRRNRIAQISQQGGAARRSRENVAPARDVVAARRVADIARAALRAHRVDVGERQAALPRVIATQEIGQVGAIRAPERPRRVRPRERVRGVLQALVDRPAVGTAQALDEFGIAPLVRVRPRLAQHTDAARRRADILRRGWCDQRKTGRNNPGQKPQYPSAHA